MHQQSIHSLNAVFISEQNFLEGDEIEQVELAITGAEDNLGAFTGMDPALLRAAHYLRLQPMGWGVGSKYLSHDGRSIELTEINHLPFYFEIDTGESTIASALNQIRRYGNARAVTTASVLSQLIASNSYDLGVIYGLEIAPTHYYSPDPDRVPELATRLKFWAESLLNAQKIHESNMQGSVYTILSRLNSMQVQNIKVSLQSVSGGSASLLEITDPSLPERLRNVKKGEVIFINVGPLPPLSFELLFAKSTLPALIAGKNAMNLAINLGLPFVNTINDSDFWQTLGHHFMRKN